MSGRKDEAHGRRLKFLRNKDFEVTEEVLQHLEYQEGELLVIESFLDIRQHQVQVELPVKWRGFSENETDWVTLVTLREDVPTLVHEYIANLLSTGTKSQRRIASSI